MAGFNVLSTVHSAFAVSDLEQTVKMFDEFLGFEIVVRDVGQPDLVETLTGIRAEVNLAFVRAPDGHMIELVEWTEPADRGKVDYRICDTGAWHMALEVDNLQAAIDEAPNYGLKMYNGVVERDDGTRRTAYFRDPDGVTIELAQRPRPRG